MAPRPWQNGTLLTFTSPRLYMCRAPPPYTRLSLTRLTSQCWDLVERETRGLKSYAVARQCMSPRRMSAYCWAPTLLRYFRDSRGGSGSTPRDANVEIIPYRKTVYVPAPYVGLLLCADLSPVEAWNRLRGAIVDAAEEDACRPLIDWIHAVIIRSGSNTHSALIVPEPSAPLPDALLLQHHHWLLLSHLPGIDLSINQVAVTRITETGGQVAVELRETRLENKRV